MRIHRCSPGSRCLLIKQWDDRPFCSMNHSTLIMLKMTCIFSGKVNVNCTFVALGAVSHSNVIAGLCHMCVFQRDTPPSD